MTKYAPGEKTNTEKSYDATLHIMVTVLFTNLSKTFKRILCSIYLISRSNIVLILKRRPASLDGNLSGQKNKIK